MLVVHVGSFKTSPGFYSLKFIFFFIHVFILVVCATPGPRCPNPPRTPPARKPGSRAAMHPVPPRHPVRQQSCHTWCCLPEAVAPTRVDGGAPNILPAPPNRQAVRKRVGMSPHDARVHRPRRRPWRHRRRRAFPTHIRTTCPFGNVAFGWNITSVMFPWRFPLV